MTRIVITFLLSLCFLLVRGYNHLYARVYHKAISYSPAKRSEASKPGSAGTATGNRSIRKSTSSGAENDALIATEVEDDTQVPSRKYIEITNYFLTCFYTPIVGDVHRYLKNRLPFCKHFPFISSDKYIVQRVIRI